jgi:hypothetical protein
MNTYQLLFQSIFTITAIITLTSFGGCAVLRSNTSAVTVNNVSLEALKSSEYEVLGETEGTASQTTILGCVSYGDMGTIVIPLPIIGFFLIYSGGKEIENQAKTFAIHNKEGSDALISPRTEGSNFFIPGIYSNEYVRVKAKAIKIKERK